MMCMFVFRSWRCCLSHQDTQVCLFLFLEALCLPSWHTCLFICSWRHCVCHHNTCVCLFVFYCHCLYHHLWLVISIVCLGNVVVKGNKLGLVGDVCACSFVVCSWNHYFYHVAFGWWSW
jgi:hypothetical protein